MPLIKSHISSFSGRMLDFGMYSGT